MTLVAALLGIEIILEFPNKEKENQCRLDFKYNKYILLILTNTDSKEKATQEV